MTDSIWRKPKQYTKPGAPKAVPDPPKAEPEPEPADLDGLTVSQLRKMASKKGITGFRSMKKADLIDAIS